MLKISQFEIDFTLRNRGMTNNNANIAYSLRAMNLKTLDGSIQIHLKEKDSKYHKRSFPNNCYFIKFISW